MDPLCDAGLAKTVQYQEPTVDQNTAWDIDYLHHKQSLRQALGLYYEYNDRKIRQKVTNIYF